MSTASSSAASGSESPSPRTSKVYNNITVYVPAGATDYFPLMFKRTTSAQLVRNMRQLKHGYFTVVQTEPPQQLALSDLKGKQGVKVKFIEDVELRDGLQLAVVLDRVSYYPTARQLERTKYVEDQGASISGGQRGHIQQQAEESKCAEWALSYLHAADGGAHRFCHKIISWGGVSVEIDCLAFSPERLVLVDRKPVISHENVVVLEMKATFLRHLVEAGAPNTGVLLDAATGEVKPLELFLMADGWVDDADEVAACMLRMKELKITPLLPRGDTYEVADSCHLWPKQKDQAFYRAKAKQQQLPPSGSTPGAARAVRSTSSQPARCLMFGGHQRPCQYGRGASAQHHSAAPCRPACSRLPHVYAVSRALVRWL